jgi:hypothetical protein
MKQWDAPRESDIEDHFVRQCRRRGWKVEKFTSPGRRSVPDRIVSKPGGQVFFCELKAPGKDATPLQAEDHEVRRALGFRVYVADTKEACDSVIALEEML